MGRALLLAGCAIAVAGCAAGGAGAPAAPAQADPLAAAVAGFERHDGLFPFYLDRDEGKVWLELPAPSGGGGRLAEVLYVEGLASGLGSNPVGLDRGQLGDSRILVVRRLGPRVLFEIPNLGYRASSEDPAERRAAEQSFATSVLWSGPVAATSADGRSLVDVTGFLVRDAHGVAARLAETGEGSFALDPERSAVDFEACRAFDDNLEFEALLTYAGTQPGPEVRATSPVPDAFTLVQHHSLVRLPPAGYRPRAFDPRAGSFAIEFQDYAAEIGEPLVERWIVRHRLRPAPDAPAELVYYVDRGIPEPVRGAVLDGARWWAEAFDEAGFPGAFRVELLPEDAHPLDVNYNVIQWVHRATRGWSYGGGVVDPRTGEMIKGHVSLGSLRVRQDRLIFEGLLGAEGTGGGGPDDPIELSLARIRQLSAHEVGHTLGLAHNFAASTYGRASVMDYPAPKVEPAEGGGLDASGAYGVSVGAWDRHAVRYAYAELPEESEAAELEAIVEEGLSRGWLMLSDADARPAGAALPEASLWDNGDDAAERLGVEMEVRRRALGRFGEGNVARGRPLALLEETLATLYFRHRYQLEAAVKGVGGVRYRYAVRGDGQPPVRPLGGGEQRRALEAVLATLRPEALELPDSILELLHPRPFGYWPNRELFRGRTAPVFDPLAAASTAAGLAVDALVQPERAARLVDQARRYPELPGLEEVLDRLVLSTFDGQSPPSARRREIVRAVQQVVVDRLIGLAADATASPAVRARVEDVLIRLRAAIEESASLPERDEIAHQAYLARRIDAHFQRLPPPLEAAPAALEPPPGSPIGSLPPAGLETGCSFEAPWLRGAGR